MVFIEQFSECELKGLDDYPKHKGIPSSPVILNCIFSGHFSKIFEGLFGIGNYWP